MRADSIAWTNLGSPRAYMRSGIRADLRLERENMRAELSPEWSYFKNQRADFGPEWVDFGPE